MFDLRVPESFASIPSRIVNQLGPVDQGDVVRKWTSKAHGSPMCQMTVEDAFDAAVRQFVLGMWGPHAQASKRTLFINRGGKLKWERPSQPIGVKDGTYGITIIGRFDRDCNVLDILRAIEARQEYFLRGGALPEPRNICAGMGITHA